MLHRHLSSKHSFRLNSLYFRHHSITKTNFNKTDLGNVYLSNLCTGVVVGVFGVFLFLTLGFLDDFVGSDVNSDANSQGTPPLIFGSPKFGLENIQ